MYMLKFVELFSGLWKLEVQTSIFFYHMHITKHFTAISQFMAFMFLNKIQLKSFDICIQLKVAEGTFHETSYVQFWIFWKQSLYISA